MEISHTTILTEPRNDDFMFKVLADTEFYSDPHAISVHRFTTGGATEGLFESTLTSDRIIVEPTSIHSKEFAIILAATRERNISDKRTYLLTTRDLDDWRLRPIFLSGIPEHNE